MLRSELHRLNEAIGRLNQNYLLRQEAGAEHRLEEWNELIGIECAQLKGKWTRELFRPVKEQVILRYIQFHQAEISRLSNILSAAINQTTNNPGSESMIIAQVLAQLEDLLNYLRHSFYRYFDYHFNVTIYCCRLKTNNIKQQWQELMKFPHISQPAGELLEVIDEAINRRLSEAELKSMSYYQMEQLTTLLRLCKHFLTAPGNISTDQLGFELIRYNFNTPAFFHWYQNQLEDQLIAQASAEAKKNLLRNYIRSLRHIAVNASRVFESGLPPIADLLIEWLEQRSSGATENESRFKISEAERLQLSFSVPQFALFLRLFYLEGGCPGMNISVLLRFFARHFSTKKQQEISVKSLAHSFYASDQTTAAIVRDYLQRMISRLNKTYFPK